MMQMKSEAEVSEGSAGDEAPLNGAKKDAGMESTGGGEKEGAGQKLSKALAGCGFCCFKFKEKTQISALEFKIANRQKKFGVDYLTLVEEKASQAALKECLKAALQDVAVLQEQINDHYDKIDSKKAQIDQGGGKEEAPATRDISVQEEAPEVTEEPRSKTKKKKSKKPAEEDPESAHPNGEQKPSKKKSTKKKKKKAEQGADERFTIDE